MKNSALCILFLVALLIPEWVGAQVGITESIVTDSVDLTVPKEKSLKSSGLAMAATLLLPGSGHQYLGMEQRAFLYYTTEALCLAGAIFYAQYSAHAFQNAQSYASVYAQASGGTGVDEKYWQRVGEYLDSRKYNEDQELNRTPENKYVAENLQWHWADESFMNQYQRLRHEGASFTVVSGFFLGALVLNHIIAFVDVRAASLDRGIRRKASVQVTPSFAADFSSVGLHLVSAF